MKPGRKSRAELSVIPFRPASNRLEPPRDLSAAEAKLFREVIANCPSDHFLKSDLSLLASFIRASVLSRQLGRRVAKEPHLAGAWEKVTRTQALLATRLRLTPRGRTDPKMLGRKMTRHQPGIEDVIAASGVNVDDYQE